MKVQGSAVLIKPDVLPERNPKGKLIVPKSSTEMLPDKGTVIDCGPECSIVQVGDRVQFPRKSASAIVINEEDFYFTYEHKLFYVGKAEMSEYTCSACGKIFKANYPATVCSTCYA